jgi:hypothetical protein
VGVALAAFFRGNVIDLNHVVALLLGATVAKGVAPKSMPLALVREKA